VEQKAKIIVLFDRIGDDLAILKRTCVGRVELIFL
jgi:hypothetical protein